MSTKKVVTIDAQTRESKIEYRDTGLTPEEIAELEKMQSEAPAPTPTIEERMASVEEDTAIIRAILLGEETRE